MPGGVRQSIIVDAYTTKACRASENCPVVKMNEPCYWGYRELVFLDLHFSTLSLESIFYIG